LPITGDGSETRDWTYVEDIVNGLVSMGIEEEAIGEAINLGSGKDHKVVDMANKINDLTGNSEGIAYAPRRDWDAKNKLISSIDKAKEILDYKPTVSFDKGLKRTYGWFIDNWNYIEESAEF
ncbi:MAG: GDP-mannose 4,6-dehydratase, partial [Methanobrevibacter sp.]|nr:GDP-mannose 4,6-dehydratase [Methanobrevibacter sp.]